MPDLKAPFGLAVLALLGVLVAGAPVVAKPLTLLAFGDSLVHGYGLPAGATFPEQLEAALAERGYDVQVVNSGNSGETTAGGRARLDWVLAEPPDAAIVVLGGNDLLRGLDPKDTHDNMDAILTRLDAEAIPTLLAGMAAPRNLGADYVAEFDAIFPRLAEAHDVVFYPFFLDGVALEPALNQADGLHPNRAGVRVIVERLLPDVIALLARAGAPPAASAGG